MRWFLATVTTALHLQKMQPCDAILCDAMK